MFYPSVFEIKLNNIKKYYKLSKISLKKFYKACNIIRDCEYIKQVDEMPAYDNYIFEGSQGLLLDKNIGFFPHVTRSNTGTKNLLKLCKNSL